MEPLTCFGLFAVSAMVVCMRSRGLRQGYADRSMVLF
jgi:hypothetical protein